MSTTSPTDLYAVLAIPKHASQPQIKSAYRRLLLQSHPDKRTFDRSDQPDLALIKHAYATLNDPERRAAYDSRLALTISHIAPRPAQVISLEEFDQATHTTEEDHQGPWCYPCRCGGSYTISTALMEDDKHLVACSNCSEVVWVGFEQVDDER